jgi:hypothetical protein
MLALLWQWQTLADLKDEHTSFSHTFKALKRTASSRIKTVIENIQYFHECSDGAKERRERETENEEDGHDIIAIEESEDENMERGCSDETGQDIANLTEDNVEIARQGRILQRPVERKGGCSNCHGFRCVYRKQGFQGAWWSRLMDISWTSGNQSNEKNSPRPSLA